MPSNSIWRKLAPGRGYEIGVRRFLFEHGDRVDVKIPVEQRFEAVQNRESVPASCFLRQL
ncbi:hypothetical protein NKJ71_30770 [Mesorhizobium sp. M0050]|uniref:hypothetical protein n=1 Tax=Mesorhizobium sp. M0050 TaxID=2956861 RepID=UPI00333C4910